MAVIVFVEVHGQTVAGYEGMVDSLADGLRHADGFVTHCAYSAEGNLRVVEIWQTKREADRFFAEHVAPNLPAGVRPKRSVHEVHGLVTRS
jgi:hypothetical protein